MKQKWYTRTWIWTMGIFAVLAGGLLVRFGAWILSVLSVLTDVDFWTAVGSVGTLGGIIVAVVSITADHRRRKRQATMDSFCSMKKEVFELEERLDALDEMKLEELVREKEAGHSVQEWGYIKQYLTAMEQFAVGVNLGIFDVEMVDRMGGYFLYTQYQKLYPVIRHKRDRDGNPRVYEEFRDMVNAILAIRKKRGMPLEPVK